jgi:hypothetical protein
MLLNFFRALAILALIATASACSTTSSGEKADDKTSVEREWSKGTPAPKGSKLARVRPGMTDLEVRRILGAADHVSGHTTGKAWIPFYWGSDTSRTEWFYEGVGRVVFSRNRYSGRLKAIRVLYNKDELK